VKRFSSKPAPANAKILGDYLNNYLGQGWDSQDGRLDGRLTLACCERIEKY
jgi:hypothetical protein